MSLMDNNNGMVMPVSPMYGGGGYGNFRICRPLRSWPTMPYRQPTLSSISLLLLARLMLSRILIVALSRPSGVAVAQRKEGQ